jgi:uncharacterized protein YndB with AHSA1/START domain
VSPNAPPENEVTIERTLAAPVEKVWKLWTTKDGLEKWWGPEGFSAEVCVLDVRVGGRFEIVMTAVLPEIVAHLKSLGIPASSTAKGTYTEIEPNRRLVYDNAIDFLPGVVPYTTTTRVELTAVPGGTRLVVENDAMHDAHWTEMAKQGWESQLGKLEKEARVMSDG